MSPYRAFAQDERTQRLPSGKYFALESIMRDIEAIMNGDPNHPTLWWHISDKAKIAAGYAPDHLWKDEG